MLCQIMLRYISPFRCHQHTNGESAAAFLSLIIRGLLLSLLPSSHPLFLSAPCVWRGLGAAGPILEDGRVVLLAITLT